MASSRPAAASSAASPADAAPIPSTFLGYVRSFGPGFVVVLTWLGAGDIVSAGVSGGNYGYALMWAMVIALLMRYFFVTLIARYQLCNPHGEGVLDGLVRLHPAYAPFLFVVALVLGHVQATYMIVGAGELSVGLSGLGRPWQWAVVWVAVGLLLVFRPAYTRVEWIFKGFVALLSVSLLGTAVWVGPDLGAAFEGTVALRVPPQEGRFGAMLVAMSMIGAVGGSLMNLVYPYFLEEKGWRGPQYRRVQTYDFILAIAVMIVFNLAVWTLGAELVHAAGRRIDDLDGLTALLGETLGPGGRRLFLVGVFAAVYTSLLGHGLGLGYLASHAWQRWRLPPGSAPASYRAHPAYRLVVLWILVSPLVWVFASKGDFISLTLLANSVQVVLLPALAGGLWWITASARFIGPAFRNRWWENLLMALLFVLAVWGAVQSVLSVTMYE